MEVVCSRGLGVERRPTPARRGQLPLSGQLTVVRGGYEGRAYLPGLQFYQMSALVCLQKRSFGRGSSACFWLLRRKDATRVAQAGERSRWG